MKTAATTSRIEALAHLLKDSHEEVRRAAAQALESLEETGSLNGMLELLKKGNLGEKVRAIYALGKIGGDKVLPPLLYCVTRPEEDLKAAAIEALGPLAHPSALPYLMDSLSSEPNTAIKARVIEALGYYRKQDLVKTLEPFLDAADGILDAEAALAIGRLGGAALESKLIALLASPHATTRAAAATALGMLPLS